MRHLLTRLETILVSMPADLKGEETYSKQWHAVLWVGQYDRKKTELISVIKRDSQGSGDQVIVKFANLRKLAQGQHGLLIEIDRLPLLVDWTLPLAEHR